MKARFNHPWPVCVAIGMLTCAGISGFPRAARAELRSVTIAEGVGDWVVHEASGRVFATATDGNEVIEFDSSAKEVRRFKVGETPTELIIKRDRLIVACTKSPALHVIDLKRNEEVGVAKVSGTGPYALFCSQVDNDFVYCVCNTGTDWWDGEVYQIDVRSYAVRKHVKVRTWRQWHVLHVAMSRDGKWIVSDARGAVSPSGAYLMKVDEEELTFTQVRDYNSSFGEIVADPMNRFWTFGNALYTLDITKKVGTFAGSPVAIHPFFDLAASKSSSGLALERFSDAAPIDTINLTEPSSSERTSRSRPPSNPTVDPTVQFDFNHNLVFVGTKTHGHWIDLQAYEDKLAPLKQVQAPSEVSSLVGRPLRVPLQITNADRQPLAKLRIADGPKSATLTDDQLLWTPQPEDVGFVPIRLELVSVDEEKTLDTAELTIHVTLPKVDLEFNVKTMDLSADGRYLIAWGLAPGQESRDPAHPGSDDVAIIDLKTLKIITRKTLPQGIRCATIDEKYVYLSPNSGNLFYRLDHSLGGGERQFLQSAPQQLTKLSPNRLAVVGEQLQVFDTDTMQSVSSKQINSHIHNAVVLVGRNKVQVGPRLFDRQTGKTLRITSPVNLPTLVENNVRTSFGLADRNQTPTRWGRRVNGSILSNHKGSRITEWPGGRSGVIAERWPMAVMIAPAQQERLVNTMLELCNLIDGTVRHAAVIDVSPRNNSHPGFYGAQTRLLVSDDTVLYLKDTELLVATIPENIAQEMPVPAHFLPEQETEIELSESAVIPLRTGGPRDGVTFSLLAESPGIKLDSKSGELTVDVQSLWNDLITRVASGNSNQQFPARNQPPIASRAENAQGYKELTGKELPEDKFAAHLPISAVLQDSEGQEDGVQFSIVVVGTRQALDAAIETQKAAQAQKIAQMEEAKNKQREAQALREAEMKKAENQPGKSVNERLDELEARARRIEAALDAILKRLEEI